MITQARLKELLHYDPEMGVFTWINHYRRPDLIGTVAGSPQGPGGYIVIAVCGREYKAHRLAWLYVHGRWPVKYLDHANRLKQDNRIDNLREATRAQNEQNKGLRSSNTSGVTGVYWSIAAKKWMAYIRVNEQSKYLGIYEDKGEAIAARRTAELRYFGEFASAA